MDEEILAVNYDELVLYIHKNTGYEKELIDRVLDLEESYLREFGIITCE